MDRIGKSNEYVPDISNSKPGILQQCDKTCSLTISSEKPDSQNLSSNKQDSDEHSSDNPEGVDLSTTKPAISVSYSEKSDSIGNLHDNTGISIVNSKFDILDKLSDIQDMSVFPTSKFSSYVNSNNKSKEADLPNENSGSGAISSDKHGSSYFSNVKPGSCDFSCDEPWSENFPSRKSRNSGFLSENIWGSNFSSDNSVSCAFSNDKPLDEISRDKLEGGDFSIVKFRSDNFSSGKCLSVGGFLTDNHETCDFSGDKPWIADFSSDKTEISTCASTMPVSLDLLNEKLDDSKDFNSSLENLDISSAMLETSNEVGVSSYILNSKAWNADFSNDSTNMPVSIDLFNGKLDDSKHPNSSLKKPDTSSAKLETSKELGVSSHLLNGKSCLANNETEESKSTNMSCAGNCFENTKKSSKSFDSTENLVIETSVIPSYLIETSGILGDDPSNRKTVKEINDIHNFSRINSKCLDYESFDNGSEVIIADGIWKIEKRDQSSNVCVLKRLDEDTQYKFKCIYFNKGTKLDELFKNRSHEELNVSQEEILQCIDSMKEDQLNFIEDPIESNNQSGFLEDRMGTSMEMIDEDLDGDDHGLVKHTSTEQVNFLVDKLLSDVFSAVDKNEQNFKVTHLDIKTHEKEIVEDARFDEAESKEIYDDQIYFNKLGGNFENAKNCEIIGSQVEDISGYLSPTDPLNDSVTETTNPRNQLDEFSIQQKFLKCVKIVWKSIFSIMLGIFSSFFYKTKSLTSTECTTTQTIPETVTDYEKFLSETNTSILPSTSYTNNKTVSSKSMKTKSRITNFSTLFQHLAATVGTDMTAERAMADINSQVVMDIYNGFHELRIVDYGSLDLMSKSIRGCIVTLQRTLSTSSPIVQKASVLLRKKTHTHEEMRKLNEDLKDLTSDAEVQLHNIDRALTGLEDFTDDFMYYKNGISKELVEFLLEDFPEIFK